MNRIVKSHIIPENVSRISLSQYVLEITGQYPSRKSVSKAIKRGEITINSDQYEPGKWVLPGQKIDFFEPKSEKIPTYNKKIYIIYEDKHIAIVEKPPGIMVNGNAFKTLEHMLPANLYPSSENDALARPRPVHRIDAATGGLVLVAKTSGALIELARQFENQEIVKKYKAIVIGQLDGQGEIKDPVDDREALTVYHSVKTVPSLKNGFLSLMDLYPKSGRTHQLRKHLSGIGAPILGDKKYGRPGLVLKSKGLFLWAIELTFHHPETGQLMNISIDPPLKFQSFLKREKQRWERYKITS